MGHGSPDVTHRHYVHLADVLLHDWISREPIDIDDKALAYAFQTSYDNIRQIRRRNREAVSLSFLSERFTRNSTIPTPKLLEITTLSTKLRDDLPAMEACLKPSDIDRLLAIATMRNSIDGLANSFLTSEEAIASLLLAASDIQQKTGYVAFAIPAATQHDLWIANNETRLATLDKESKRVRSFLGKIDHCQLGTELLGDATKIWEASFHPHSRCLLISKRSELERLLDCLKSMGINAEDFEAYIPEDEIEHDQAKWTSIRSWLASIDFAEIKEKRLPLVSSRLNANNRIGLMLRASDSHQLGYQRTLNRALFITSVWLQLSGAFATELNL